MKDCNRCKLPKDSGEYSPDKRSKDGLQGICRLCVNLARREQYQNDEAYRSKEKNRQRKYLGYANTNAKKHVESLSDFYIIKELKRGTALSTEDIKAHPELIEAKRQIIKNKRLCRRLRT